MKKLTRSLTVNVSEVYLQHTWQTGIYFNINTKCEVMKVHKHFAIILINLAMKAK